MPIYASRNANKNSGAWRDEDIAMAHKQWGPFDGDTAEDEARLALVVAMREEARWLEIHAASEWARHRSALILAGADKIEAGEGYVETEGLTWMIGQYSW